MVKAIQMEDYGRFIADLLSSDRQWAEPLVASLRARVLFLALFSEGLRATEAARRGGTLMAFYEWPFGDRFDLKIDGRAVGFERAIGGSDKRIGIIREGFPPAIVPWDQHQDLIEAPIDSQQAVGLASEQIRLALALLLRKLD